MEFKSFINPHEQHKFAEGGFKKTVDIYEDIVNERTGKLETKKTKEENFYEKIQAQKESQTLENIIKRYNIDLNEDHITEISAEIVDMTNLPQDLIETYALTKKLESMYHETTADIKNHFKDFAGFLQSFQKGTLQSELQNIHQRQREPIVQAPVVQPVQPEPVVQTPVAQQPIQQTAPTQNINQGVIYG